MTKHIKKFDPTVPLFEKKIGSLHPITLAIKKISDIFKRMHVEIVEGPEVETEFYNFEALNMPSGHPARDMWSTFWLEPIYNLKQTNSKFLLRTHTSPVQARYMERHKPPFKIIVPGKCYRFEATDRSHNFEFYQVEGLFVDKVVSVAHFKGYMAYFLQEFFENDNLELKLKPSYFPFTEPSFEIEMTCFCSGKGCLLCKNSGMLEIGGAGLVHPKVFENVKYPKNQFQGFAFGVGVDRLVMLKYGISDIRMLYDSDLRIIKQF